MVYNSSSTDYRVNIINTNNPEIHSQSQRIVGLCLNGINASTENTSFNHFLVYSFRLVIKENGQI